MRYIWFSMHMVHLSPFLCYESKEEQHVKLGLLHEDVKFQSESSHNLQ